MQPENSYYYFQKAFSPDDCKKIIERGEFEIGQYKKEGSHNYLILKLIFHIH